MCFGKYMSLSDAKCPMPFLKNNILDLFLLSMTIFVYVHVWYSLSPEEGVRSLGIGVKNSLEPLCGS